MKLHKLRKHSWSMTFAQIWWLAAMLMMFALVQTATGTAGIVVRSHHSVPRAPHTWSGSKPMRLPDLTS